MGLTSAFVDRCRIKSRTATSTKIDGEKQKADDFGSWIRCRLELRKGSEVQADGRRKKVVRPMLMVGRKVVLKAEQVVEVDSKQLGHHTYQVDGDPEPMRRKRTVIGWEAALVKSEK